MSVTAPLPQLTEPLFITDGGLETYLIFQDHLDLPDFAAFPLLDDADGRAVLDRYYGHYVEIAERADLGVILDTPTWRANADWGIRLGYDPEALAAVNARAVDFVRSIAARHGEVATVVNGVIGPRGDGYAIGETMTADEAARYHSLQTTAFAGAGADMITAVTMTYVDEAVGIARAASEAALPVAIGFTTETDGRLPSGTTLAEAIDTVDRAAEPAYFMVNCAHPTHFVDALTPEAAWLERIKAIRANASTMSHAELDDADELDRGSVEGLAEHYCGLDLVLPDLRVIGGCCGTDHEHIAEMARQVTAHRGGDHSSKL